jgi:hypothetical protein
VARGVDVAVEEDVGDDAGDGAVAVAVALPVGTEEGGADSRPGVLAVKPWVCDGGLALCVHAVTPRPMTAGARNIRVKRAHELFMIDPSGLSGEPRWALLISPSPRATTGRSHPRCGVRPPRVQCRAETTDVGDEGFSGKLARAATLPFCRGWDVPRLPRPAKRKGPSEREC